MPAHLRSVSFRGEGLKYLKRPSYHYALHPSSALSSGDLSQIFSKNLALLIFRPFLTKGPGPGSLLAGKLVLVCADI